MDRRASVAWVFGALTSPRGHQHPSGRDACCFRSLAGLVIAVSASNRLGSSRWRATGEVPYAVRPRVGVRVESLSPFRVRARRGVAGRRQLGTPAVIPESPSLSSFESNLRPAPGHAVDVREPRTAPPLHWSS